MRPSRQRRDGVSADGSGSSSQLRPQALWCWGAGQLWFFSRPRSTMLGVLFPMGYVLFNALLVAGIVGLVVSLQLRHETRRNPRVSHMEALVRLHDQGAIDDEELLRALRDTVR